MEFILNGEPREGTGRAASRTLRRRGRVPAVVYGAGKPPSAITLDFDLLNRQIAQESFYTSILTIKQGSESDSVIVKEVQRHPSRGWVLHLDFQRIVADEEITLHVPLHFVGAESAKGVKEQGGEIEHMISDIEISCLPRDLPEYIEVDVSGLELNQVYHLSELTLPPGVTSVALAHDHDPAIVGISLPRLEEEPEAVEGEEIAAGEVPTAAEAEEEPEDEDKEAD